MLWAIALDDCVVGAVATGVNQHGPLETQGGLKFFESLERRIGRRVAAPRRVRVDIARTKDVAVGVAGSGWWFVVRLAGVGIGRPAHRYCCCHVRMLTNLKI